jgi:hypothetical protein
MGTYVLNELIVSIDTISGFLHVSIPVKSETLFSF